MLDLGVGAGESALEAQRAQPGRCTVGLDLSAVMVRRAAARALAAALPLPLLRANALRLPVRSGALDGLTGHSLLYLVPEPAALLAEAVRALRPGGRLALLEPAAGPVRHRAALAEGLRFAASMALWRVMSGLHRRFDPASLADLLRAAGLREVRVEVVLHGFALLASASR